MRVLVACEYSGIVRDAFLAAGHDALSCDLLPTESPGPHYRGDVRDILHEGWDLMIAHPPCTYLANSGVRWLQERPDRKRKMVVAASFFRLLLSAPIPHIAIENPIMHGHAKRIIKEDQTQVIQPWQHGCGESKAICLWLRNLPRLRPTDVVCGRAARVHRMPPSPDRQKERSRFFPGVAGAMAAQWGPFVEQGYRMSLF